MVRRNTVVLGRLILMGALGTGAASSVFAAGGNIALRTDNGPDGYYYGLAGTGSDRFINEYLAGEIDPSWIVCGARWSELNHGTIPPPGMGGCDLRLEDPGNPGYPDLVGGLIATADPESLGTCGAGPRIFTFNSGAGVPVPSGNHYISALEPVRGAGPTDFCGTRLDTSSPYQGFAKFYSGGVFGALLWNHFIEEIVVNPNPIDLGIRASGSARYPGDRGIPVVYTRRPNTTGAVSDDNMTLSIAIDNRGVGSIARNLAIAADQSVIDPKKGLKLVTGFFRPLGGGTPVMSPITLPVGRTVLRLEMSNAVVKQKVADIVDAHVHNLPLVVLLDDPAFDTDPLVLEGPAAVDSEGQLLGLRRRAGSADDNSIEAFFRVQFPNQTGDSLNVRFKTIDMPKVAYNVTGFTVVGGEFGGSGLPGLDAIELRTEDPVFVGSPDLTGVGLLRSFGTADGIGEAPLGAPPTTAVFDATDLALDPTGHPGLVSDLYVLGLFLPGEGTVTTAIGADTAPADTILGDSSFTVRGQQPNTYTQSNVALRVLIDADGSTLESDVRSATMHPRAYLREINREIYIGRHGR